MEIKFAFKNLVLQPISLCNLNCTYCYLPNRDKNLRMKSEITEAVAKSIINIPKMRITWHGGEPLTCGLDHFKKLIQPFVFLEKEGRVKHSIQTNATLIDDDWCEFFLKHQFTVGVSIDGPQYLNKNRVDWSGKESYLRIIKGIECLKRNGLDFPIIAVVNHESLDKAKEI
ncbi:radical SAM protein [Candidatus Azambacteria bacterium]|nr:radical SAM protein [Candidatus Azambacteria bacterium]